MSHMLARAVDSGRSTRAHRRSREAILSALLAKRAAAHRAGLRRLERLLRNHILWGLPMRRPADESEGANGES
jgi:hypothetical protein